MCFLLCLPYHKSLPKSIRSPEKELQRGPGGFSVVSLPTSQRLVYGPLWLGTWTLFDCILCYPALLGCFHKLGVLLVGVLIVRALLFGVRIRAPDFGKLPLGGTRYCTSKGVISSALRLTSDSNLGLSQHTTHVSPTNVQVAQRLCFMDIPLLLDGNFVARDSDPWAPAQRSIVRFLVPKPTTLQPQTLQRVNLPGLGTKIRFLGSGCPGF